MPKLFVFVLAVYSLGVAAQKKPAVAGQSVDTMPRERAEATFKDPRVTAFLKSATDGFHISCTLPDPANTKAKINPPDFSKIPKDAPPDVYGMASTWYEVAVPCTSDTTVNVKAEFTPLTGEKPLNLVLSLSQTFKQ